MLQIALEQNQCDCLVATLIAAMKEALELGSEMMQGLSAVREDLMDALADDDAPPIENIALVDQLLSSVTVPQFVGRELSEMESMTLAMDYLNSKGLIDKILIGEKVRWSLEAVRQLADQ